MYAFRAKTEKENATKLDPDVLHAQSKYLSLYPAFFRAALACRLTQPGTYNQEESDMRVPAAGATPRSFTYISLSIRTQQQLVV